MPNNVELRALLAEAVALLIRYRNETPPCNQPHMIAHDADAVIVRTYTALAEKDDGGRLPIKTAPT